MAGPERIGLSYNKISRIIWSLFRIYGQFSRSLRPVYEAEDAVGGLVDAVEAAGGRIDGDLVGISGT